MMHLSTAFPEGVSFKCFDNCGFCCLFQVELRPWEQPTGPLELHTRDGLVDMKGRGCFFLRNGRCSVYPQRPAICRLYPFNLHLSSRPQVSVDLSCPGVELSGEGTADVSWIKDVYPPGLIDDMVAVYADRWLEALDMAGGEPDRLSIAVEAAENAAGMRYIPPVEEYPAVTDEARLYPVYDGVLSVKALIYWKGRLEWRDYMKWDNVLAGFSIDEVSAVEATFTTAQLLDYARILADRDSLLGYALLLYMEDKGNGHGKTLDSLYRDIIEGILSRTAFEARAIALLNGEAEAGAQEFLEAVRFHDHTVFVLPTYGLWL